MQDKLKVLEMIGAGTITAAEGTELLKALETTEVVEGYETGKTINVKIKAEGANVNVSLPLSIAEAALTVFKPQVEQELSKYGFKYSDILAIIRTKLTGEFIDIETEEATIKVSVE